jgi:hypothetical protein
MKEEQPKETRPTTRVDKWGVTRRIHYKQPYPGARGFISSLTGEWIPVHDIRAEKYQNIEIRSALSREEQVKKLASEIVKGVTVEVVKGKNFPIGTTGKVFWVATKPDNFNNFRVGFITANGKKVFINIELLAVKEKEK